MELRVLRYFLAVAREENISRAASVLHITQPTLSRQLMELESELGVQLFSRKNKGRKIVLTQEGQLLRRRAQELLELADKTGQELKSADQQITGDIYIGGGETDAMRLIARTACELHKDFSGIRYHLYSGNSEDVMERLDKGLLDFGVIIQPADVSKYDYIQLPAKDTWGLLMKKNDPLAQKDLIVPEDLNNIPILASRQSLMQNELNGWLGKDFNQLNIIGTYNLVYNASLMVDEGLGYALCLEKLIYTGENSTLCFRPLYPPVTSHLAIIWKKSQVFSRAAEKFLKQQQQLFVQNKETQTKNLAIQGQRDPLAELSR